MARLHWLRLPAIGASLHASIGDIAFGMEDGAVSIAGLVFGVAASTGESHIVLLAGATGAVAGAVSMMAGTYLDVQSSEDRARARVAALEAHVRADPSAELAIMGEQLARAGLTDAEIGVVTDALARNPGAVARYAAAFELGRGRHVGESALVHAAWMFVADICAAAIPVLPFALLDIGEARIASLLVTSVLLLALGIGRGLIGHQSVLATAAQTLAIAGAAALAGIGMGKLVSG
jgi:vacuolar iron transporter family protein